MGQDRVARPVNKDRAGGIKGPKSAIVESASPSSDNLNPYNRKK